MRILPSCSEGARRLSILLAALTFAGLLGLSYVLDRQAYGADIAEAAKRSDMVYVDMSFECRNEQRKRGLEYDHAACAKQAEDAEQASLNRLLPSKWVTIGRWTLYVFLSFAGAYMVCLFARSISWVRQGFTLPAALEKA